LVIRSLKNKKIGNRQRFTEKTHSIHGDKMLKKVIPSSVFRNSILNINFAAYFAKPTI
jgi:hypothetical protein